VWDTEEQESHGVLLGFDFEDWNQLVDRHVGAAAQNATGAPFKRQLARVFELLEELHARATFFLLGITAERSPALVEEILTRGHEVASHGYSHTRVYHQDPGEFRRDVERSIEVIEKMTGRRPLGYRAPAFSLNRDTPWAHEVLVDLGFGYDSSYYDSPRIPRRVQPIPGAPYRLDLPTPTKLWEFPLAVWRLGRWSLPIGGGSYWRILPAPLIVRALRARARAHEYSVIYFHPYDFDPELLRPQLPNSPSLGQVLRALHRLARANPGRKRVPRSLRTAGQEFELLTYEDAYHRISDGPGTSQEAF
jgi:polysaccharide deacetylase family protein (PEP-CTERM system associated)